MRRFAVIGLGRFGEHLARALAQAGDEVIAIDRDSDYVDRVRDDVTLAVRMDSTDKMALVAQGIAEVDAAIVTIGEAFESSILTVVTLKELGVPRIIARAMTDLQGKILRKVGADEIASAEQESAMRWAHRLSLPNLSQYIELEADHSLVYIAAPAAFVGKTLLELRLRADHQVNLVAIRRDRVTKTAGDEATRQRNIIVPIADTKIESGDVLIVVGHNDALSKLPQD
ncbi:MAG TPA: TrkA family potassium uptake protein [Phycisphaerae bacterium]|nr:TrkA family potassium uptake protein [Phycisphaerae bacterium]